MRRFAEAGVVDRFTDPVLMLQPPILGKRDIVAIRNEPEGMVEMIPTGLSRGLPPVDELHGGLEGAVAVSHPLILRETEEIKKYALKIRNGRLADSYFSNVWRLDKCDLHFIGQGLAEIGCRHPAGASAS